jgi:predicted DNA-binding transcriptional regulator AlpA
MTEGVSKFDDIRLLDLRQVAGAIGRSPATINEWVRLKIFPPPFQARPGGPKAWRFSTVQAWIEKRARARYSPPAPRGQLKRGTKTGREG